MVSTRSAIREASGEPESLKQTRSRTASKSPRTVSPTQSAGSPERPVRRKLKNTKIDAEGDKATNTSSESGSIETTPDKASTNGDEPKSRGRPKKKRSFDELEDDKTDTKGSGTSSKQPRKRSRSDEGSEAATADSALDAKVVAEDMSQLETTMAPEADGKEQAAIAQAQEPEEQNVPNDPDAPPSRAARPPKLDVTSDEVETAIASPKNKRNRDSFIQDQSASTDTKARNAGPTDGLISTSEKESTPSTEEPDKKKLRDEKSSEAESLTKVSFGGLPRWNIPIVLISYYR